MARPFVYHNQINLQATLSNNKWRHASDEIGTPRIRRVEYALGGQRGQSLRGRSANGHSTKHSHVYLRSLEGVNDDGEIRLGYPFLSTG